MFFEVIFCFARLFLINSLNRFLGYLNRDIAAGGGGGRGELSSGGCRAPGGIDAAMVLPLAA